MEPLSATALFATLGHSGRLGVLRLLIRRLPDQVRPSEIAALVGLKRNTLSAHLAALERAGLVSARRDGRAVLYRAEVAQLRRLARYVVEDCGRGRLAGLPELAEEQGMSRTYNVLFICTGNSARSIFAEAILDRVGAGKFRAHSAGTQPSADLNPQTIAVLERAGHDVAQLRSKSVTEFQGPDAPKMDFVFTVCDRAAAEECPPWPGQPVTAHWGLPDPVKAEGTEAQMALAFAQCHAAMRRRILAFTALPFSELDRLSLQARIDEIGSE